MKKSGDSATVHIHASIMAAAKLRVGQAVDIREECGRIVIAPLRMLAFDLDELVAGITAKNRHAEVDFGDAVGDEIPFRQERQ